MFMEKWRIYGRLCLCGTKKRQYKEYDLDCIFKQNPVAYMSIKDYLIVCDHKLQVTDWSD